MDIRRVDQTAEDGMETSRRLRLAIIRRNFTLKDDEIDVETSELRKFLGDDVRNLRCILGKCSDICQRTKQQIHKEIDEQIKEVPEIRKDLQKPVDTC